VFALAGLLSQPLAGLLDQPNIYPPKCQRDRGESRVSRVTFLPAGKSGDVSTGISLLDAAEQLGVPMRNDCGGFATCSTCRVWVQEGMSSLSPVDLDEENMLEEAHLAAPYRLSCQSKILGEGDVVVRVDDPEMDWTTGALRDLDAVPSEWRALVRMRVEKRARRAGLSVILPDTSVPYVAEAKAEVDALGGDPELFSVFVRRVHEEG
jgi:ferredoxin